MSRSEKIALAMDGPRQRLHLNGLGFHQKRHAARKICDFLQHGLRNPFGKGKQSSFQKPILKSKRANNNPASTKKSQLHS
jgi:hypothetical protein